VRAPHPTVLAQALEQTARILRTHGTQAQRMATLLAARGYPTSTLGNGTRSSDTTTSTERAIGLAGPDGPLTPPDPGWIGVDDKLANEGRALLRAAINHASLVTRILAHASDDDPLPAGIGYCQHPECDHLCDPRKNPDDRLRSNYCPMHHKRWVRLGKPSRGEFERWQVA